MWSAVLVGQSVGLRRIASGWLGWLVLVGAVGVAMAGVFSHGGPAGLHRGTMRPEPARQSLSSLPLAAQGPISRVLGAANRSYVVHRGAAGLSAVNAAQGLRIGFGRSGVLVRSGLGANFTIRSATQLKATVPDGATAGQISVTTPVGTANSSASFIPTLSITGFTPTSGPVGTVVDIKGIGFTAGSIVKFNGTAATTVTYVGSGEVTATVPAGASTGPVTLTTLAGTVRARSRFYVT